MRTQTEGFILLLFLVALILFTSGVLFPDSGFYGATMFLVVIITALFLTVGIVSFVEVPATPPSVAVPTFLGAREASIIREGWAFVFPGIENLIIVDYLPKTVVWSFDDVRTLLDTSTKAEGSTATGGAVTVEVSCVFVPDIGDADRMISFLNNGGKEGIEKILKGMAEEAVRHLGATMTWEQLALSKVKISAELIARLTGKRMSSGSTDDEEAQDFVNKALTNGVADIHDLGIKLRRLNVTEVEPEGELKEFAAKAAEEKQRRQAELVDAETLVALAHKLMDGKKGKKGGASLPYTEALELARIVRGHATENIVRSSGNPVLDAAAFYANWMQKPPSPPPSTPQASEDEAGTDQREEHSS